MITEDYCSYEVAKLLKEKGFDEPCDNYYNKKGSEKQEPQELTWNEIMYSYDEFFKAPTHQMAMKWLREVHSLCICIYYLWPCGYEIDLYRIGKDTPISEFEAIREYGYDTYEDAVEAALKYSLKNLI